MGKQYKFNKHIFDDINTEDKAYWLGFLWGDVYVCKRERRNSGIDTYEMKLDLSVTDIEHLEKFKMFLESTHPIHIYKSGKSSYKPDAEVCRLYISNNYFAGILYNKYGIITNRFDVKPIIENISPCLFRHFIRGIFDAEGCIVNSYTYEKKRDNKYWKSHIAITTYEEILVLIQEHLLNNKIILNKSNMYKRHENDNRDNYCRVIKYCGNNQVIKIMNYLYKDTSIYLQRKYNKFLEIKNKEKQNAI